MPVKMLVMRISHSGAWNSPIQTTPLLQKLLVEPAIWLSNSATRKSGSCSVSVGSAMNSQLAQTPA